MKKDMEESVNVNTIAKPTNIILNIMFLILSALCILPLIFVVIISFTSEQSIVQNGYSFIPKHISFSAYKYLIKSGSQIVNSYKISIIVTIVGTLMGLFLNSTYAYVISRGSFRFKKFFIRIALIPMLFSGGMVSFYLVVANMLDLKNTIWALTLPMSVSSFYIIVLRTFFKTSIPESLIESAKIEGAGEFTIYRKIVLPISLPGLATVGLFLTLGYWNDWFNALLFIDREEMYPLQFLLMKIESNLEFMLQNSDKMGVNAVQAASSLPNESFKMAIVVISVLPIVFAYPFFQRYFIQGLTIGAVKE